MDEPLKIKGIVVKTAPLGDNDKMLTLLTHEKGVISVSARGVKSLKNKNAQAVMPLCYSDFVLKAKGDIYSLVSADTIENFYHLRENVQALSYGVYFSHLASYIVGRDNMAEDEVRLLLNCLFLLCKNPDRCDTLRAAFEIKMCEYAGFAPYMESCSCGKDGEWFDVAEGEVMCSLHKTPVAKKISKNALLVAQYVQNADLKEALTFDTPNVIAREVSDILEAYLTKQLGRLPKSLDYIKKIIY